MSQRDVCGPRKLFYTTLCIVLMWEIRQMHPLLSDLTAQKLIIGLIIQYHKKHLSLNPFSPGLKPRADFSWL
jgi:hypothetical protein